MNDLKDVTLEPLNNSIYIQPKQLILTEVCYTKNVFKTLNDSFFLFHRMKYRKPMIFCKFRQGK